MRLRGAHKLATTPGHHYFGSVTDEGDSLACHGSRIPSSDVIDLVCKKQPYQEGVHSANLTACIDLY